NAAGVNTGAAPPGYSSGAVAPIGTIEATGSLLVNGRVAEGTGALWDGELVQALPDAVARASMRGVGDVTLKNGAAARLAVVDLQAQMNGENTLSHALTVSVVSGEIDVRLQPAAAAWLVAGGSVFAAGAGADFRIGLRRGQPFILEDKSMAVRWLGNWGVKTAATPARGSGEAKQPFGSWAVGAPGGVVSADTGNTRLSAMENDRGLAIPAHASAPAPVTSTQHDALLRSIRQMTAFSPNGQPAPLKLYANPMAGMLGAVESSKALLINGRAAHNRENIWEGEYIQAPPDAPARVTLAGMGQVMLSPAAGVRLRSALMRPENQAARRVLIASVTNGDAVFRLAPESAAIVDAAGTAYAAGGSAHFRLTSREGTATIDVNSGAVESMGRYAIELAAPVAEILREISATRARTMPRKYRVQPVGQAYQTLIPLGAAREMRYRVINESGKPVPGARVRFTLAGTTGKSVGTIGAGILCGPANGLASLTVMADANGVVTIPFTAGTEPGSVSVHAAVENSPSVGAGVVTVPSRSDENKFWTKRNAIPVLLTAGAMVGIGAGLWATREERFPIRGIGETVIMP
ncbi:MAG: hypothetical protein ACKV2V_27320, partial [Blastocatellia bacterium]